MTKSAIVSDTFVYVVGKSMDDLPESAPEHSIFQDDSDGCQYWMKDGKWKQANFKGSSKDIKPTTDVTDCAWFYEEDTRTEYQFIEKKWVFVSVRSTPEEEIAIREKMEDMRNSL